LPFDDDDDDVLLQIIVGDARQAEEARAAEAQRTAEERQQTPSAPNNVDEAASLTPATSAVDVDLDSTAATGEASGTLSSLTSTSTEIDESIRCILGDLVVPEGIDPSFLAALPSDMREEVIAEHLRLQRLRQRTQQTAAAQQESVNVLEVSPEFLAALPPNIQEEVLAEQRIEQQRQAAAAANPADPVDAAAFFQNLQPSLRQAVGYEISIF
jgi:E3 ubiquitin-protein ligase HUWE1